MIRKRKDSSSDDDHNGASTEYEVGYGRPPIQGRFKPGQSGNPKGIRKRRRNVRCVSALNFASYRRPTVTPARC
ncbi:DUF5681 domain-containing protein [Nitrobacter sp. Nb-311A]|uniref:DUF5681 domain-containing protein n=1 Tax=Nitrobacter sp. Nb-311A TaxID=314253 RepID=UPI000E2E51E0|nr:DUF5681 domain-containing protein [Nitrobacter sp. Nb-311A]